jgi:hypothetical protein
MIFSKFKILLDSNDKDFETLLNNCKKNKVSQSLLYLARALTYIHTGDSSKIQSEKKALIEVFIFD